MQFDNFFIDYKLRLKTISERIIWPKLPLYRKISLIAMILLFLVILVALIFQNNNLILLTSFLTFIFFIVFLAIDSTPKNQSFMLNQYYKPYSRQRTSMIINLLNDYNISEFDTDRISLLINQTKEAQIAHNPFSPIIDPIIKLIKGVSPIIISIISYIPQKTTSDRDLQFTIIELSILFCAILGIYIMFAVFSPILKDLIYRDYSKYNSLIYDLNQIKIFQPNQTTNFSNHFSSYKSK